ncbi:MAG: lysine biosynthesis protein LysW [Patescibacteria group bacterium]|nr:MAG: lysine biosynthesis protein LysW [Patescibacteria group bacterium]
MIIGSCPLCHSDVILDDEVYEQDLLTCSNCGKDLEVASLSPLCLEAVEEE